MEAETEPVDGSYLGTTRRWGERPTDDAPSDTPKIDPDAIGSPLHPHGKNDDVLRLDPRLMQYAKMQTKILFVPIIAIPILVNIGQPSRWQGILAGEPVDLIWLGFMAIFAFLMFQILDRTSRRVYSRYQVTMDETTILVRNGLWNKTDTIPIHDITKIRISQGPSMARAKIYALDMRLHRKHLLSPTYARIIGLADPGKVRDELLRRRDALQRAQGVHNPPHHLDPETTVS